MNAVKTEPRFVDQGRAEGVSFIQREDLSARLAGITKVWERVPLQSRLAAKISLESVVAVQPVVTSQSVANISGPLIDINRRGSRPPN